MHKLFTYVGLGISVILLSLFIQSESLDYNTLTQFSIIPDINAESNFDSFLEEQQRLITQGRIKDSFVRLENALSLYESNAEALNEIGLLVDTSYNTYAKNSVADSEIQAIYTDIMFKIGDKLQNLEFFDVALSYFDKVLDLEPFDDETLARKGYTLFNMGDKEGAKIYLDKALQQNPCNHYAVISKGLLLESEKKYQSAITIYNETLECYKIDYKLLNNLGVNYMWLSEYEQATTYFHRILNIDSLSTEKKLNTYMNLGTSYSKLEDYNQSIANYGKVLEINPNNSDALNGQSFAYFKKGDIDTATYLIERALEYDEKNAEAIITKGQILAEIGDHEDAIILYDKALESEQDYGESYTKNRKADSLFVLERYDEAIKLYDETSKLNLIPSIYEDVLDAQVGLGDTYSKKEDCTNAIVYYQKAIESPLTNKKYEIQEKLESEKIRCINLKEPLEFTKAIVGILGVGSVSGLITWLYKYKKKNSKKKLK